MLSKGLRGLLAHFWKFRARAIPGLIALIISDGCQLAIPMAVKSGVDLLAAGGPGVTASVRERAVWIVALTAVIVASRYMWRHYLLSAARSAELDLRERLLDKVMSLPAAWFSQTRTGEIMALATNDVSSVRMALAMGMVAGFDATVFAAVALGMLAVLDWRLMLWTAIPFPVLFVIMAVSLRVIYHRWDRVQEAFSAITEKARESLSGMRVLRAYVQDEGDRRDFERFNRECYERQLAYVRVDALFQPSILVLAGMSTAILVAVGGARVIQGQTTLGSFTAFSSYLGMLTWPMIAAGWVLTLVQRGAASMARINDMLDEPPETEQGAVLESASGAIEARDLRFTYPGASAPALDGVSFRVPAGGSLGLVGEVGSGKSTLAALLVRIYDPPRGQLFLDGRDVNDVQPAALRRQAAYVPQEAFLFSDTIEENLRLGDPQADDARLREACAVAAVHEEIEEFPTGYQTMLGERGVTLSGGQKQRLSLARALLKVAPVLVLDDTLSAVDADAERRILDRLAGALQRRTSLVISHRISAVRDLDWILVLREGGVVQEGRHAELVAAPGYYRELYELQELEA